MNSPAPRHARISIIGAGPGGLTCARILQRHGITVTVHDRDPGPDARNQGGTLDLHADNGQLALREASLRPGTVHWGRALDTISGPADGPRQLHFADGTTIETDLVIGADGAFSRVRPAVSPAVPEYTGVSFLEARFSDVENRHPDIAELVGLGGAHAADGRRALFAQRNSGSHIRVYIIQRVPADWISANGLTTEDTDGIRAVLRDEYAHWSPRMRQLITENDGRYIDRPLFALPVPHTWEHNPTVTLLGDAAHLMPPLGVGVNLAMLDAGELALALANAPTIDNAIHAYEQTMLPRSTDTAKVLEHGAEHLLSTDVPDLGGDREAQP